MPDLLEDESQMSAHSTIYNSPRPRIVLAQGNTDIKLPA
jgi:hypothetical protein